MINVLPPSSQFYNVASRLTYPSDGIVYLAEQQQILQLSSPGDWSIFFDQIAANPTYWSGTPVYCVWCESGRRGALNGASHAGHVSEVLGGPTQGYLGFFGITDSGLRVPPLRNFGDDELPPLQLPFRD